jgi:hypothetical protein
MANKEEVEYPHFVQRQRVRVLEVLPRIKASLALFLYSPGLRQLRFTPENSHDSRFDGPPQKRILRDIF